MKSRYKKILFGVFAAVFVSAASFHIPVYADSPGQQINGMTQGSTANQAEGDLDVDIGLQSADENQSGSNTASSQGNTQSSSPTRVPTNNVGTGLGDKVSANAKTGDILNGRNVVLFLLAVGGILVIVSLRKGQAER